MGPEGGWCEGGIYSTVNVKGDRHFPQKRDLPKVRLGFLIVENVASPKTQTVAGKGQTGCSQYACFRFHLAWGRGPPKHVRRRGGGRR